MRTDEETLMENGIAVGSGKSIRNGGAMTVIFFTHLNRIPGCEHLP